MAEAEALAEFARNFRAIVQRPTLEHLAFLWGLLAEVGVATENRLVLDTSLTIQRAEQFERSFDRRSMPGLGKNLARDLAALAIVLDERLNSAVAVEGFRLVQVPLRGRQEDFWIFRRRDCGGKRKPVAFRSRGDTQGKLPHSVFTYHKIIPRFVGKGQSIEVKVVSATAGLEYKKDKEFVDRFARRGNVLVYAAAFSDWAVPRQVRNGKKFIFVDLNGTEEERRREIKLHLRRAFSKRADVILFPELAIPPSLYEAVERDLGELAYEFGHEVFLTVAGSWHVLGTRHGWDRKFKEPAHYNAAPVLNYAGHPFYSQRKLFQFMDDELQEYILTSDTLTLLETEFGVVAVAICKDAGDEDAAAIWRQVQPDWMLVPSLGGEQTESLLQRRMSTLVGLMGYIAVVARQDKAPESEALPEQNWGTAWIRLPTDAPMQSSPKQKLSAGIGQSTGDAFLCQRVVPPWWRVAGHGS